MVTGGLQIRVLGPVEVVDGAGDAVSLSPQPTRLLALLMAADGSVSRDQIAEYVTNGDPRGSAVRTSVARLRKVLGDRVVRDGSRYRLDLTQCDSDAERFLALVAVASETNTDERIGHLTEALSLWRGPAYGDLADEHWALAAATALDTTRAQAADDLAEALIDAGAASRAVLVLESEVLARPLAERPAALLMRALADDGRAAEAARAFQRFRAELAETGLEPSHELADLERRVLAGTTDPTQKTSSAREAPTGTVTFLFTDVVGSTRLWDRQRDEMAVSLRHHDQILKTVLARDGYVFSQAGDGWGAAFSSSRAALDAAVSLRDELTDTDWPGPALSVRVGLHVGDAEVRGGDYFGPPVNLAARVAAAANGGQILATGAVREAAIFEGVDLGTHHLRGLSEPTRLWQVGEAPHGPLQAAALVPVTLPATRTHLVGRDDDAERVRSLLADSRLVTITGVGGAGKTRLSVEVARRTVGEFPAGVHFVDLTLVEHDEGVRQAFVRALGSDGGSSDVEQILTQRCTEPLLLVVDNCEHLLDPVADLLDDLLVRFDVLRVLATSREALEIDGERTYRLRSLDVSADGPAVALFVDRASAARPDFDPDDVDRAMIADVCAELDGMPLAIEMAAARVRSMSLVELRDRLDQRFELLSGGRRRARRRQQTLDAVVSWSYEMLDADEQQVLRRLAVLTGPFDVETAAATAAVAVRDGRRMLDSLVAKSLLEYVERDGLALFSLLETIRLFALDRLVGADDANEARRRLTTFLADRWYRGPIMVDWVVTDAELPTYELDRDRVREMQEWCLAQGDLVTAARLFTVGGGSPRLWNTGFGVETFRGPDVDALFEDEPALLDLTRSRLELAGHAITRDAGLASRYARAEDDLARRFETAPLQVIMDSDGGPLMRVSQRLLPDRLDEIVAWSELPPRAGRSHHFEQAAFAMALAGDFERACELADSLRSTVGPPALRTWLGSVAAYVHTVAGDPERAIDVLDATESAISTLAGPAMRRAVARATALLALGRVDEAVGPFVAETKRRLLTGGRESTYLAVFAWLQHLTGDQARAELLIDHTVKRFIGDFLITCHAKSVIAGWQRDEFRARWSHWHDTHVVVGDLPARCDAMADLRQEELRYWS